MAWWLQVLNHLDAHRAHAFAANDPSELALVYVPGPLLDQDRTALHRDVPTGCILTGLHSVYRVDESVQSRAATTQVTVRAALATSVLHCTNRPARTVAGVAMTRLRIQLVHTAGGWRIRTQTALSALD